MSIANFKAVLTNYDGTTTEASVSLTDYEQAGNAQVGLSTFLAAKYPNAPQPFVQMCAQAGLFMKDKPNEGIHTATMNNLFNEKAVTLSDINASALVRDDGSNRALGARVLFPELILQTIAAELDTDDSDVINGFLGMIATTLSVNTPRVDEPIIDVRGAEQSRAQPIAQLAEPDVMVSISTSERTRKVPTKSIGLLISDEAAGTVNLPLVSIIVQAQARGERIANIYDAINRIITGNVDAQDAALVEVAATSYDSTATTPANFSQMAYVKWLWDKHNMRSLNAVITDLDGAMAIESRKGKPTVQSDNPTSPRINSETSFDNILLPSPKGIVVPTATMGAADRVLAFDRRYGIRRVVNTAASYSAVQEFVLKRGTGYRFDYGEAYHKLFASAFSLLKMA